MISIPIPESYNPFHLSPCNLSYYEYPWPVPCRATEPQSIPQVTWSSAQHRHVPQPARSPFCTVRIIQQRAATVHMIYSARKKTVAVAPLRQSAGIIELQQLEGATVENAKNAMI